MRHAAHRFAPCAMLAAAALASGCTRTNFTLTDAQFVPTPSAAAPPVYIDRLPAEAYHSVGVIEVIAPAESDLPTVLYAASVKGKEVGCNVVIERSLHMTKAQKPVGSLRWEIRVADPAGERGGARREGKRLARRDAALLGNIVMQGGYAPPPSHREFVCGVFDAAPKFAATP